MSPRGAVNFQNSLNSGQAGVGGTCGRPARSSTPRTSANNHSRATSSPIAIGIDHAAAIAAGRAETTSTATTNPSWSADFPIRSTSALGTIVPKPRVAAMATVYAHEIGRNTAITRM